jgi:hypothetical protein
VIFFCHAANIVPATPQYEKFIEYEKGKNLHASMAPQLQINSPAHLLGIY